MIRALGETGRTNTILLPHAPSAIGNLMDQIRDGILVADLTSETVAHTGNRGAPNSGGADGSP